MRLWPRWSVTVGILLTTIIHFESWQESTTPRLDTEVKNFNSVKIDRRVPSRTPSNAVYGRWLYFGSSRPKCNFCSIVSAATRTKLRQSVPNRKPIGPDCATTDLEINTGQHDHALKYADDVAMLSRSTQEASCRITSIAKGSLADGKLEAHTVKSEHMPILLRDLIDGGYVSEEDIKAANFKHVCPHCNRSFSSKHGLSVSRFTWVDGVAKPNGRNSLNHSKSRRSLTPVALLATTLPKLSLARS